jgi:PAS domain S-box-containing protein
VGILSQIDVYFPPETLKAALILSLLSVWVLVGLYAYLNRYTKRRYFSIWTAAWLFYALWLTLSIRFHPDAPGPLGVMLQQWCIGVAAVFLLWGSAQFLQQKEPQRLYALFIGFLLVWGYVGAFHLKGTLQVFLPTFSLLAGASFWTAWGYFRESGKRGFMGARLLGVGFVIWGVYLISFPIFQDDPYFVSSLYFISGIVQMFVAVSMIVLMLEESRALHESLRRRVDSTESEAAELNSALTVKTSALRASESRFRAVAMAAPVGIMEADVDGYFVFVNARWKTIAGLASADGFGGDWTAKVHPEDRVEVRASWARSIGADEPFSREFRFQIGESLEWVLGQSTMLHDENGKVDGRLVTLAVISDLKLEQERSVALEAQLRQAQKLETLGTLAGGIAHGFNNLLQPILGFTNLATDSLEPGHEAHEDLDYVTRAALRATELVKQMLTFSRQAEHERMPLLVHPLVNEAIKLMRASMTANIPMVTEISTECPPVLADATQINQVVMNLCANAYHAVRDQGGSIRVELTTTMVETTLLERLPGLKAGEHVLLRVIDTGEGMDSATLERVFEPFFTTKRGGQGTGLGLSVVHGIVMSHDGALTVESEPGKGSSFSVYLPTTTSEARIAEPKEKASLGGGEHILFVDDEEEVALLGKKMLERLGYRITLATDSLEAREVFNSRPDEFDLVITDQMMPHLTGENLAREMLVARKDIPIIMITGYGENATREMSADIGIREFMLKPVGAADLGNAVRRVLDTVMPSA